MKAKNIVVFVFLILFGLVSGYSLGFLKNKPDENKNKGCGVSDFHYSYFSNKSFFDDAYKNIPQKSITINQVKGILVNHHLLAPNLIAETIDTIATKNKITVVLISPNHFSSGQGQIISSLYQWDTPYGILNSDCENISKLEKQGVLNIDEYPFKKEHGISGIIPFIKKSLPNAKIIPIIIKETLSENDLNKFVDSLYATLGNNVLIIGSFDFSHYLPDNVAQFHDKKSISVIKNFDYIGLKTTEIDSVPGLEITMRYMEKEGALNFNLIANTNSSQILHDPTIEETTSYINGSFSIGNKALDNTATISTFGDMMLDRFVRQKINTNSNSYPFDKIKRFLIGSDIVVANAEGVFTSYPSETLNVSNAPLKFTFDLTNLTMLNKLGFTLFSQANNHALDFGKQGLKESGQAIEKFGMNWFGDPLNKNLNSFTTTIRGQKITFIGYHQFSPQGFDITLNEIQSAKKNSDFVVVYPHWGMEYNQEVTETQIKNAYAFIDAGADVIIGSHPHVIEPIEIYKNKAIFYSLGNFIFDQDSVGPTSEGLSVGIAITPQKISYYLFPLDIRNAQASLMSYDRRSKVLSDIAERSFIQDEMKKSIKNGILTLDLIKK